MSSILRFIQRHRLLVIVGTVVLIVIIGLAFYTSTPKETLVAESNLTLAADQSATDTFTYSGSAVNQSMTTGCSVPASLRIDVQSLTSSGTIEVYINDELYATGTISNTGEAMLSSGCGCSTTCVCEIKVGDNVIKVVSDNFSGQLTYQVYVK